MQGMKKALWMNVLVAGALLAACDPNLRRPDVTTVDPKTGEVKVRSDAKELEAGVIQSFPDIPIPANFTIDYERSLMFTSPSQTVGRLVAEGNADVDSLFRFYTTKMKENGWNIVNAFQSSTSSMYFAKTGRFVAVILETQGRRSTRLTINLGPE